MANSQVDFSTLADLVNDARIRAARELQLGPDAGQPAAPAAERGPWNAFVPVQIPSAGFPPADGQQQETARPAPEDPASPVPQESALQRQAPAATSVGQADGGGTRAGAGMAAQEAINNRMTAGAAKTADALYGKAAELISPAMTIPLTETGKAVYRNRADRNLSYLTRPQRSPRWATLEEWEAPTETEASVPSERKRTEGMTYEDIKTLRDFIRATMNGAGTPAQKELREIERGLTDDLRAAAKAGGGDAAVAFFDRAENAVKFAEQRGVKLKAIIGVDGKASPEQVLDRLSELARSSSQADISTLAQARRVVQPEHWNDVASGLVARLGSAQDGAFSLERFARSYGELSAGARSVLFRSAGKGNLANSLEDIAAVASRWNELEKQRAASQGPMTGLVGADGVKDPVTTVEGLFGGRLVAQALAHPATASPIAKWMRAHVELVASPSPERLTELNHASRILAQTMEKAFGTSVSASDLSSVLKIPRAPE